jgi:hypothetical protein
MIFVTHVLPIAHFNAALPIAMINPAFNLKIRSSWTYWTLNSGSNRIQQHSSVQINGDTALKLNS